LAKFDGFDPYVYTCFALNQNPLCFRMVCFNVARIQEAL
jgi:hypothetical protein